MKVRAKFKAYKVEGSHIVLEAVKRDDDGAAENKGFFWATPSAKIEMAVVSPETASYFVEGGFYYVTFDRAS